MDAATKKLLKEIRQIRRTGSGHSFKRRHGNYHWNKSMADKPWRKKFA